MALKWETPTVEGRDQWLQVLRRLASLPDGEHTIRLVVRGRLPLRWLVEIVVQEGSREQQAG